MPKILFKTIDELRIKCEAYMSEVDLVAPRSFRIYLGLSKQTLSAWKKSNKPYFDLIKSYEDKILAIVEELTIYGASHPLLANRPTSVNTIYDKEGNIKSQRTETKYNAIGAINTLRAYDTELYVPEFRPTALETHREQIVINAENVSGKKLLGMGTVDGKVKVKHESK